MKLRNCRLIGRLSDFENENRQAAELTADVELKDGKIEKIVPAGAEEAAEGDIDCKNMTLMPGMYDLHVHMCQDENAGSIAEAFKAYHTYCSQLGVFLDYGVTTVRDCGSAMRLAIYLRDGVNKGLFEGPHIYAAGHIISPEAMYMASAGDSTHVIANGPEDCMKQARREFAAGADFIKIYATQSLTQVHGQDPKCIYSPEELKAMVGVAQMNNSYVAAHAHSTDAINSCLRNGVRTIEHATYMDEESIRLFNEIPDSYAVLTHAVSQPYLYNEGYDDPRLVAFFAQPHMKESSRRCRAAEGEAFRKGVRCGVGTDLGPESFAKYPYELEIRHDYCGMSCEDALYQATRQSAIICYDDEKGLVKEGFGADLILVDGKPDEDLACLHKKPVLVLKDGEIVRNRMQ